ncbi:MAG: diacylglycerol kinase family lipid kinase [Oscillospiraceae bacterium]|nr:diacylglycerol kinase family lipid kinase [Oscillospiraceae bacterium]
MAKTLLLIVNPRAGRTHSMDPMFHAIAHFSEEGYLVSVRCTTHAGHATEIMTAEGANYDRIVCSGGDGTLNETVRGAMTLESPPPIGYIPSGSTNDFASSLALPGDPVEAARQITASEGKRLDVGSFNERPFIYVASFGAFTRTSYNASQSIKNDLGHLAYLLEGVRDLSTLRPYPATVATEEEVFDGEFLFGAVTNSTSVGGLMKLQKDQVVLDDGQFEMILVPNPTTAAELQELVRALVTQDFSREGVVFRHVSSVTVTTPEGFPWTLDGEYEPGAEKVEIQNLHQRLEFLL